MTTTLIRNATLLATMDVDRREIANGAILVDGSRIVSVGPAEEYEGADADVVINAAGMVLLPGLVNTHHHFFQTLTRAVPAAQDANLFTWLRTLYPIWAGLTTEAIQVSTRVALAELLLSGCTTASDHTYIWPNGARIDDQIEAAVDTGVRFHASRGSMSAREALWLAPGKMADLIGVRIDTLPFAGGAVHDPLAALVFCQPRNVDFSLANGQVRVSEGRIVDLDLPALVAQHNRVAVALAHGELATRSVFWNALPRRSSCGDA